MPYIEAGRRAELGRGAPARTAGELTYQLQVVVQDYLHNNGLSYQHLSDVMGALEGLKFDIQRRILAPYEENKQRENGEVWSLGLRALANGTV